MLLVNDVIREKGWNRLDFMYLSCKENISFSNMLTLNVCLLCVSRNFKCIFVNMLYIYINDIQYYSLMMDGLLSHETDGKFMQLYIVISLMQ